MHRLIQALEMVRFCLRVLVYSNTYFGVFLLKTLKGEAMAIPSETKK